MAQAELNAPSITQSLPSLSDRSKNRSGTKSGERYLQFQLPASESQPSAPALIQMSDIQEVLSLSVQRLSPMPNMPSCVLGLMNRGNRIFWLVDLAQLLGISRLEPSTQQHSVIILRSGSAALGLAVNQVESMQWLGEEETQSAPPSLPSPLTSFVAGSRTTEAGEPSPLILDGVAILQAPVLRSLGLQ